MYLHVSQTGCLALVCASLLAASIECASAQFPPEVRGHVVERGAGVPIAGARVEVLGEGTTTRTEADGSFILRGLAPGERIVRVRALGYAPASVVVDAENGLTVVVQIELSLTTFLLSSLNITAAGSPPPNTTVITSAEIRASGARDVAELLRGIPGVTITRRGGPSAPASISIRGSNEDEVLVLRDEVPLNSPITGVADLSLIPLESVERIVLLRGAQSGRYGSGALAGVVWIEGRRPGAAVSLRSAVGAWGERSAAFTLGAGRSGSRAKSLGATVSGEWVTSDGSFEYAVPAVRGGGRGSRVNAGASIYSLTASGGFQSANVELRTRFDFGDSQRGMPGSIIQSAPNAQQMQRRHAALLQSVVRAGAVHLNFTLDGQRQNVTFRDPDPPLGAPYDASTVVNGVGGTVVGNASRGPMRAEIGLEIRTLGIRSTLLGVDAPDRQSTVGIWGGTDWSWAFAEHWSLRIAPGVRLDNHSLLGESHLSPGLSVSAATRSVTTSMSWGGSFSPPSIADQFFQEGVLVEPNPDLEPERVRNDIQLSVEVRRQLIGMGIELRAAAYRADVDGMIVWFPDHRFVWSPANFDVHRSGWEAVLQAGLPVMDATLQGNVSRSTTEYAGPVLDGQLVYRPRTTAGTRITFGLAGFGIGGNARYLAGRRTVPGSELNQLDPYWMVDARLTRSLSLLRWRGELRLSVDNLLATDAAMLIDYPFPRRGWRVELLLRPFGSLGD